MRGVGIGRSYAEYRARVHNIMLGVLLNLRDSLWGYLYQFVGAYCTGSRTMV